ncbi:hypothetical protein SCLCIDRAFT_1209249 [Scleroderma citrinum Foug A]|uniref:Uncharacterized protein n=1 Tax=Scleroderma citrinum Foug A TaxID=1036808 RepID=A0A0C3E6L0_9AGAM|nr:hypothetical protein SCLCIDRAFT_1209249 [Scleroderma citrinum Foug A]
MTEYKQGNHVEYRPVGGASENVSHTTGVIEEVQEHGDDKRYAIKNDNTGKTTSYQGKNIVQKIE